MSKIRVFRRVGGRIRSFLVDGAKRVGKIVSEKATEENTSFFRERVGLKQRVFSFKQNNRTLGTLNAKFYAPNKTTAVVDFVQVNKGYRGKGISNALFEDLLKFSKKAGIKNVRSESIENVAQIKIRAKHNTKFIGKGFGAYGEQTRIISAEEAIKILRTSNKKFPYSSKPVIQATTHIPKELGSFKKIDGKIRRFQLGGTFREAKITSKKAYAKGERDFSFAEGKSTHGRLEAIFSPGKKKTVTIDRVHVEKEFRGKGVSSALFEDLMKFSKKSGTTNIRSYNIISPAQIKIRAKYDTKFLLASEGKKTKIISSEEALKILNGSTGDFKIRATTKVK